MGARVKLDNPHQNKPVSGHVVAKGPNGTTIRTDDGETITVPRGHPASQHEVGAQVEIQNPRTNVPLSGEVTAKGPDSATILTDNGETVTVPLGHPAQGEDIHEPASSVGEFQPGEEIEVDHPGRPGETLRGHVVGRRRLRKKGDTPASEVVIIETPGGGQVPVPVKQKARYAPKMPSKAEPLGAAGRPMRQESFPGWEEPITDATEPGSGEKQSELPGVDVVPKALDDEAAAKIEAEIGPGFKVQVEHPDTPGHYTVTGPDGETYLYESENKKLVNISGGKAAPGGKIPGSAAAPGAKPAAPGGKAAAPGAKAAEAAAGPTEAADKNAKQILTESASKADPKTKAEAEEAEKKGRKSVEEMAKTKGWGHTLKVLAMILGGYFALRSLRSHPGGLPLILALAGIYFWAQKNGKGKEGEKKAGSDEEAHADGQVLAGSMAKDGDPPPKWKKDFEPGQPRQGGATSGPKPAGQDIEARAQEAAEKAAPTGPASINPEEVSPTSKHAADDVWEGQQPGSSGRPIDRLQEVAEGEPESHPAEGVATPRSAPAATRGPRQAGKMEKPPVRQKPVLSQETRDVLKATHDSLGHNADPELIRMRASRDLGRNVTPEEVDAYLAERGALAQPAAPIPTPEATTAPREGGNETPPQQVPAGYPVRVDGDEPSPVNQAAIDEYQKTKAERRAEMAKNLNRPPPLMAAKPETPRSPLPPTEEDLAAPSAPMPAAEGASAGVPGKGKAIRVGQKPLDAMTADELYDEYRALQIKGEDGTLVPGLQKRYEDIKKMLGSMRHSLRLSLDDLVAFAWRNFADSGGAITETNYNRLSRDVTRLSLAHSADEVLSMVGQHLQKLKERAPVRALR